MKRFIIINGTDVYIIERETMDQAIQTAENNINHFKEIIVREIETITDYTKIHINIG